LERYTVFPHAPLTEAILDIRVDLPKEVDLKQLETFHDPIKDRFSEKKQSSFFQTGFHLSPQGPSEPKTTGGPVGYLFRSPNEKKVVQVRLDGFTFNKLKPYEDWESFHLEARDLWGVYCQIAKPKNITRIALRYINKINIPLPMKDFKEYVLTIPEVASNLPQALAHFFMRLIIPAPEIQSTAIITETMEEPTEERKLPLILDIDVFREGAYTMGEEIWTDFEKLRNFKNEIFFNSLTERTKELFR